jgi:hypothetical protein
MLDFYFARLKFSRAPTQIDHRNKKYLVILLSDSGFSFRRSEPGASFADEITKTD